MTKKDFNVLINNLLEFIYLWKIYDELGGDTYTFYQIFEKIIIDYPNKYIFYIPSLKKTNTIYSLQEIVSYINQNKSSSIVKSNLYFKRLNTRKNTISPGYPTHIVINIFELKLNDFLSKCRVEIDHANDLKIMATTTTNNYNRFLDYNKFELNIEIDNDNPDDNDDQTASNEQLQQYNVDLFNLINSNLISSPAIPADETKIVNLRLSEYYIFIITLFFFDVCHDYFNKSRHNDSTIADTFIDKTTQILSTNLKLIADEWTHYYSMLNIGVDNREQNNPESFLKICRDFGLLDEEWGINYSPTNNLRFEAKVANVINTFFTNNNYNERNDKVESLRKYNESKAAIDISKPDGRFRFMSDNAMMAFKRTLGNLGKDYNVLFFNNNDKNAKKKYCKSLPANLYDGATSCKCNSLKGYLSQNYNSIINENPQDKGGIEFGNYNILFSVNPSYFPSDFSVNLPSLNIISTFVNKNNTISQEIKIKRKRFLDGAYSNSECCYPYEILKQDKIVDYTLELSNEIKGFKKPNIGVILNKIKTRPYIVNDGDFGAIIKASSVDTQMQEIDIICYIRKALCDFGQYINGVFKNGGYISGQVYRDDTVVQPVPAGDFPFVCLHGDEPACSLNTFLLRTLETRDINHLSHTVFCVSDDIKNNTVFANMHGNLLTCPVETEKTVRNEKRGRSQKEISNRKSSNPQSQTKKRKKIVRLGGSHTEFTQKKHAFEILRRFFLLSFLFKMDSKYFELYNKFCDDYYFKMDNSEILKNEQLFNERLSEIKRINDEIDSKDKHKDSNHKAMPMTERIVHNNPHENVKSNKAKTSVIHAHPNSNNFKTQSYNDLINKHKHTPAPPKHSKHIKHNKVEVKQQRSSSRSHRKSSKNKTHKNHENHENHKPHKNHNHKNVAKHLNVKPIPIFNNQDQVTV
jgi:hypothetical protein